MIKNVIFCLSLLIAASPLFAENKAEEPNVKYYIGTVTITNPWAKNTAKDQKNAAIYMELISGTNDKLIKAEALDLADRIELHDHIVDAQGVAKMVETKAIELRANEKVMLKPRGRHVMLFGLKKQFNVGDRLHMKLTFEIAGTHEVQVEVKDQSHNCCG
ncbi:MAG: copper chaperone PCu(A)C [Alphaproteobacteria bacterium]|nr:copper chaperone PCu(A)C [Alphaproteobacteria bacterium]